MDDRSWIYRVGFASLDEGSAASATQVLDAQAQPADMIWKVNCGAARTRRRSAVELLVSFGDLLGGPIHPKGALVDPEGTLTGFADDLEAVTDEEDRARGFAQLPDPFF